MAFKGITFAGQNVTPKNDGGLYQAHYGDGILWGCSMAISGDDLVIQSGEFIMGGRVVQVDGATNVDLSGRVNTTGYIQVIMNADLTQAEGSQWYTSFVESATTTFPALTQDDINDTGSLYQVQLAIVQVSGGNLTSVYSTMRNSLLVTSGSFIQRYNNDYVELAGSDTYASMRFYDKSEGKFTNGIAWDNSGGRIRMELFADNDEIAIRPKGQGVGTNASYFGNTGFLDGARFKRTTFTGGELLQISHLCILKIDTAISSTASANTWYTLFTASSCPAPVAETRGIGLFTTATPNVGSVCTLRIRTDKTVQYALGGTSGSWSIQGTIVYWTTDAN